MKVRGMRITAADARLARFQESFQQRHLWLAMPPISGWCRESEGINWSVHRNGNALIPQRRVGKKPT